MAYSYGCWNQIYSNESWRTDKSRPAALDLSQLGQFLYLLYLKEKMNFYWNCPLEVSFCGYSLGKGFPFLPQVCRFCSVVHRDVRVAFSDSILTINSFFFHFKWLYFADVPSDQDQFYLFSYKPWWKRYLH